MAKRRKMTKYSPEEKERLINEVNNGMKAGVSRTLACKGAGLSESTFLYWIGKRGPNKKPKKTRQYIKRVDLNEIALLPKAPSLVTHNEMVTATIIRGGRDVVAEILRQMGE